MIPRPDDELDKIFDNFEEDYQTSSGSMAFQKAAIRAKAALRAYVAKEVRSARINELEKAQDHWGFRLVYTDQPAEFDLFKLMKYIEERKAALAADAGAEGKK